MSPTNVLACLAVVGAAACARADVPVDPAWGKQACDECGMLLSDPRFGAQLTNGADRYFFDDVGCMAIFVERRKLPLAHAWVHASDMGERGRWVDAQSAKYADGAASPMDYGFMASGDGAKGWTDVRSGALARRDKR